jgi:transketolase
MRLDILEMLTEAGSGHTGGSLSVIDLLVTIYHTELRHRPQEPNWPQRDRLILSKGHGAPALYSVLADRGYFDRSHLKTLRKLGSILQGHPDRNTTPGVEISTGSLGQGLAVANGIAMAVRLDRLPCRVFAIMGDGECQEGMVWEAAMSASHHGLAHLCGFVDANGLQIDGDITQVMNIEPQVDKWRAFGWNVLEIDGHDYGQILGAIENFKQETVRPTMVIARTIKGKGVSFMENIASYHGVSPTPDELERARRELLEREDSP